MTPFAREQYSDPSPRLRQLGAVYRPEKGERGLEIYQSPYGWITVKRGRTTLLSFFKACPCGGR